MQLIRLRDLVKLLGISRSAIYLKLDTGSKYYDPTFPRPIRIGTKAIAWRSSEIDEFITNLQNS